MTSDPVSIIEQAGMVGIRTTTGYTRTLWFTPLDAMDVAENLQEVAERVGKQVVEVAQQQREASAKSA